MCVIQCLIDFLMYRYEKAATEFQTALTTLVSGESSEVTDDHDPLSSPQGSPRRKENSKAGGKSAPAYLPATVNFVANQVRSFLLNLS